MENEVSLSMLLQQLGTRLDFDVRKEVEASESAFVDLVWFDRHLPVAPHHLKMRYAPVLPVVAFEIELKTGLNAKHVKGSVSNLNNLGAQLSVIVIGNGNIDTLAKQPAQQGKVPEMLKQTLRDRVYRWIYAEAQPRGRVILMFEDEVRAWVENLCRPEHIAVANSERGLAARMADQEQYLQILKPIVRED